MSKRCTACKTMKPLSEYHRDGKASDGHVQRCKICTLQRVAIWRSINRDDINKRKREHSKTHPEVRREWDRTYRVKHRDALLLHKREYNKKNSAKIKAYKIEWAKNHKNVIKASRRKVIESSPLKIKARTLLNNAIQRGVIKRRTVCEQCGNSNLKIDGHHDDYNKPLDVKWLCTNCHVKRHMRVIA